MSYQHVCVAFEIQAKEGTVRTPESILGIQVLLNICAKELNRIHY